MSKNENADSNVAADYVANTMNTELPDSVDVAEQMANDANVDETVMSTLTNGIRFTARTVKLGSVFCTDNVRDKDSYELVGLVESIRTRGFDQSRRLFVDAERSDYHGRDGHLVFKGHRRLAAITYLRDQIVNAGLAVKAEGANCSESMKESYLRDKAVFEESFGSLKSPKIPVMMADGKSQMTREIEVLLKIDHNPEMQEKQLNPFERFVAIKTICLETTNSSNSRICDILGFVRVDKKTGEVKKRTSDVSKLKGWLSLSCRMLADVRLYWLLGKDALVTEDEYGRAERFYPPEGFDPEGELPSNVRKVASCSYDNLDALGQIIRSDKSVQIGTEGRIYENVANDTSCEAVTLGWSYLLDGKRLKVTNDKESGILRLSEKTGKSGNTDKRQSADKLQVVGKSLGEDSPVVEAAMNFAAGTGSQEDLVSLARKESQIRQDLRALRIALGETFESVLAEGREMLKSQK